MSDWRGWERLNPVVRYANFWDASEHGWDFGPRYVQEYQILFVQGGQGHAEVAGRARELAVGDLVFYGPHELHTVRSSREDPLRLVGLVFLFHAEDARLVEYPRHHARPQRFAYPRGLPRCPLAPRPPTFTATAAGGAVRRHAEAVVLSWISDQVGRGLERRGLLLLLLEAWWRELDAEPSEVDARRRKAVEEAMRAIDANLAAPPGLASLAARAGLSADALARAFRHCAGMSPGAYLHEQRLLLARRLLVEGRQSVAEVGAAVGYGDPFYFSRRFARRFGMPPSRLRRRHALANPTPPENVQVRPPPSIHRRGLGRHHRSMDTTATLAETAPLAADEVARFHRDGYLVVPLVDPAEADALARALDACVPEGGLRAHTRTPAFAAIGYLPRQASIAAQLLGAEPWIVQTMHLNKQPGHTGIALHQDTHYLRHEPQTLMASWLALSDSDAGNGGLCVVPGSHRGGLRQASANRDGAEHAVWEVEHEMSDRGGRRWQERIAAMAIDDLEPASVARLTVPKGSAVFFTGLTIHGSYANHSADRQRRAFATHFAAEGTWLFRTDVQELVPARRAGAAASR